MPMIDVYTASDIYLAESGRALGEALAMAGDATLTEAAEGGWGMFGSAFGKEEFGALAAKAKAAAAVGAAA